MIARPRKKGAPLTSEIDAALVARVADGDLGALGVLYDRYAADLVRFASRLAGPDEAEDVVHATFLRVIRRAHTFDSRALSARPWLFAIAAHVANERRRSLRRLASALMNLSFLPQQHASHPPDRRDLARALSHLSNEKRTVVLLAEVEGFTCDEIASMFSIPIGTVWTRLHYARQALRRALETEEP